MVRVAIRAKRSRKLRMVTEVYCKSSESLYRISCSSICRATTDGRWSLKQVPNMLRYRNILKSSQQFFTDDRAVGIRASAAIIKRGRMLFESQRKEGAPLRQLFIGHAQIYSVY